MTLLPLIAVGAGVLLLAVFGFTVHTLQRELRAEIHEKMIERAAGVLHAMALQQVADSASAPGAPIQLSAVLRSARQPGMLAVALFDPHGNVREAVPATLWFVDLAIEDFLALTTAREPISRYHPRFDLAQQLPGLAASAVATPVLEVLVPLTHPDARDADSGGAGAGELLGIVRYTLDARLLAAQLAALDARIARQTAITLGAGAGSLALIVAAAAYGLHRAARVILERNARLVRAHVELTLAAKTSALGQITSHLLHGLQGPVAGLRATLAAAPPTAPADATRTHTSPSAPAPASTHDWQSVQQHTAQLQAMIEEAVGLLGDATHQTTYTLLAGDLASALRSRHLPTATARDIQLAIDVALPAGLDSHRGGLVCLIAHNLIDNALRATPPGGVVRAVVGLLPTPASSPSAPGPTLAAEAAVVASPHRSAPAGPSLVLTVTDTGCGVAPELQPALFQPGRSSRAGGSGLGLALSRLLARQLGGSLHLAETGPGGSTFVLVIPVA